MTTLGYDQAMQLRTALVPIAYLLCTTGLLLSVLKHWGSFHEILMTVVGILVIVVFINGYPTALTTVADGFKQLRQQTTAGAPANGGPSWQSIFQAGFEQPAWDQIAEKIAIMFCQMFKWIGKVSIWFLDWVQLWAFDGLIAISPVLLGALAVPWTQGAGITFLITSFGVAAWHLGIALVDILLADIATQLFAAAGFGGGIAAGTTISLGALPVFLGALAAIVLVALALYLAVPLLIAAVLKGGSPATSAAKTGIEMALTGFGMGSVAANRIVAQRNQRRATDTDETDRQVSKTSFTPKRRDEEGGDDAGGAPVRPRPMPGGDGGVGVARTAETPGETAPSPTARSAAAPAPTPGQRQAGIVATYDEGESAPRRRPSRNELTRRQAEAHRTLGELDQDYT